MDKRMTPEKVIEILEREESYIDDQIHSETMDDYSDPEILHYLVEDQEAYRMAIRELKKHWNLEG